MKINKYEQSQLSNDVSFLGASGTETKNISATELTKFIESTIKSQMLGMFPVGTVVSNTSGANPSTYLGGTWVAFGSGRTLVGVNSGDGDFNTAEKTGGAKTRSHSHTIPDHSHSIAAHYHTMDHDHTARAHNHSTGNCTLTQAHLPRAEVTTNFKWASNGAWGDSSGWAFVINNGADGSINDSNKISVNGGGAAHNHGATGDATVKINGHMGSTGSSGNQATSTVSGVATGNLDINVVQPYVTCYFWKRTA